MLEDNPHEIETTGEGQAMPDPHVAAYPDPVEAVAVVCVSLLALGPLGSGIMLAAKALNAAAHTNIRLPGGTVSIVCEAAVLACALLFLLEYRGYSAGALGLNLNKAHIDLPLAPVYFMATFIVAVIVSMAVFSAVATLLMSLGWSMQDIMRYFERAARREKEVMKLVSTPAGMAFALGVVPFFEEFMFRGLLFGALRKKMRFAWAAGLSSAAFCGLHFYVIGAPAIFVLALACCFAFEKRKSLAPCVAIHFFWNLNAFIITWVRR